MRERLTLRIGEIRERGARRLQARRHRPHAEGIERRWPGSGRRAVSRRGAARTTPARRVVTATPSASPCPRHGPSASRATRSSAGRRSSAASSRAAPAPSCSPTQKSPVETSTRAAPRAPGAAMEREEEVVRGPVQELRVGDGARRDDAHDLAPHQLLALGGRLHLLAHGDLLARSDEARDVAVGGVVRDTRHRDRALAFLARRERELQQAGRGVRVLEEQLVEIPEAEQQQIVRVALLELPVLQHHRRQLGRGLRHESSAADRRS